MRYSLQTLMLAVAVVASATAAFGLAGFVAALIGLGLGACVAVGKTKLDALVITAIVGILVALLLPAVQAPRGHPRWTQCPNISKQIALAIHNYHDEHGCLPPAYIPDEDGKPMHSWRVLILPYLEDSGLYEQYDFSEPWDGPNNSRLAPQMPYEYRCYAKTLASATTDFVAVTGPRTVWPGSEAPKLDDVSDGRNTILLVEIADSKISWMEPRDVSLEELLADIDPKTGSALLSTHEAGKDRNRVAFATVAFVDGSSARVRADVDRTTLEALLTASGGETVDEAHFDFVTLTARPQSRSPWPQRLAVLALVFSVALLVGRPWLKTVFRRRPS